MGFHSALSNSALSYLLKDGTDMRETEKKTKEKEMENSKETADLA